MFNYITSAHKPTSVSHALTGRFTSPDELNLILCKWTQLEIYKLSSNGIIPVCEVPIYGRVSAMQLYRPPNSKQDLLFLTTERYIMCILEYDTETGEIITRASGDVQDRIGRPAERGQIGIVDPFCRVIALHLYEGLLKIIPFDNQYKTMEAFNIRLEELNVIDIKFLAGVTTDKVKGQCKLPTIAVLYQDTKYSRHIKTYQISVKNKEFKEGPFQQSNVEADSSMLIPVPLPFGGLIIVSRETITYHSGSQFKSIHLQTPTFMQAYGMIDPSGERLLLGDHKGRLYILALQNDGTKVTGITVQQIGETNIPSCISYLDNGFVFIGSTYGDSQLIKLNSGNEKNLVEVVNTFHNLGPIVDFTVVEMEREGQGQIISCSGAHKDGSIRIIRNGIGIEEQAEMECPGIQGLWSLRSSTNSKFEKYIVMTFFGETRILGIEEEENQLAEVTNIEFMYDTNTICCDTIADDCWVQVTPNAVRLVDCRSFKLIQEWKPTNGTIHLASINPTQIVLSLGGGNLVYLEVKNRKIQFVQQTKLEYEISCLNIHPLNNRLDSEYVAVGMWTDHSIRLLKLPTLQQVYKEGLQIDVLPRSILLCSFEGIDYVLCGIGDGNLFIFKLDTFNNQLTSRKKITLGTKPIILNVFTIKDSFNVFASSDRPTVIYSNNQKLLFSNVNLKEVNYMCPFHSESFQDCLAIAKEGSLMIGTVDEIQKLHIRTIPLNEQPRRIAHQLSSQTFIVTTIRTVKDKNVESEINFVKLFHLQTFELLHEYQLESTEFASSAISIQFSGDDNEYYVVGTAYVLNEESEPQRGRILVFEVRENKLSLVTEKEVRGAVYCMDSFNGKLLTGVNSRISLWKWNETNDGSKELGHECNHPGHILALTVQSRGDFILVGDLMKSVSLLVYKPVDGTIEEIAHDYNTACISATEIIDEDHFLAAENNFNLFTLERNTSATNDEERRKLNIVGRYHLGDFVNKFKHGSLVMKQQTTEGLQNIPTMLFGTVNGAIGVLAQLPKKEYEYFEQVQAALTQVVKGVGGFSHENWRSFATDRRKEKSMNFIDGDLIESCLDLKRPQLEQVVSKMKIETTVDELIKRIEELTILLK